MANQCGIGGSARALLLTVGALAAGFGPAAAASAQSTERVSISSLGAQALPPQGASSPAMSADGRYVAFESSVPNLVAGDTNLRSDVFMHDRQSGVTERVSVTSAGAQLPTASFSPSITPDGRFVAFTTRPVSNPDNPESAGRGDIRVRDRQTGVTSPVTTGSTGEFGSQGPSISADGRFVAFYSDAPGLVPGDDDLASDIFIRDRLTGGIERVAGASDAFSPSISADGRFVAYDVFGAETYVFDRQTHASQLVSVGLGGAGGNGPSGRASISADGRYVAFNSGASNLVASDTNGVYDVFVRDRQLGSTVRASVGAGGAQGDALSYLPAISADGRHVAFVAGATNLVAGDTNAAEDGFVRDLVTQTTERVTVTSAGAQGEGLFNGESQDVMSISADGRYVAFHGFVSDLVPGDTNNATDVFVRDRRAPASYAELVRADLAIAHWRFGEQVGTLLGDSSPAANNGTYAGGVTLRAAGALAGDPSTAASFDGVDDSGRVPDAASLDVGDSFTVEGWVKRSSTTTSQELMNKGAGGVQLVVMNQGAGSQVLLRKGGVSTIARSAGGVSAGTYHHVVATKNGPNSVRIYIDGVADTVQVSPAQVVLNTTTPLTFGSSSSARASLDEFAIYDRALRPEEVLEHYRRGVGSPP